MSEAKKISVRFSTDEFEDIERESEQRGVALSFVVKDRLEQCSKMQRIGAFDAGASAAASSQLQEVIDLLTPVAKQQERIQEQIVDLQTSYTALSAQYVELLQQNRELTAQVGLATEQVDGLIEQVQHLNKQIGGLSQQHGNLPTQISSIEKQITVSSDLSYGMFQRLFKQGLPVLGGFDAVMFKGQIRRLEVLVEATLQIVGVVMVDASPPNLRHNRTVALKQTQLEIDQHLQEEQGNGHCNQQHLS
jgi:prefoldin subunit 5